MKSIQFTLSTAIIIALLFAVFISYQAMNVEGSVSQGSEYMATTSYSAYPGNGSRILKRQYGTLGSFVISGANTGRTQFYNATTANASLRHPSKATSSILLADFPASAAAGTYTFDIAFTDGLVMVNTGLEATGTVTYR